MVIFDYLGVYLPASFTFKDAVFLKMGYQPQKYYWISYPILALIPIMWDKGKDNLLSPKFNPWVGKIPLEEGMATHTATKIQQSQN